MNELIPALTPIALIDSTSLTPLALVPLMQALASPRGYRVAAAFLLGLFLSYLVMALAFLFGLSAVVLRLGNWLAHRWHQPEPLDFAVELALGLLLVFFALRREDPRRRRTAGRALEGRVSAGQAFVFACTLNVVGFPGALPYFAAADAIMRADLPSAGAVAAVVYYVVVFLVPLAAIVALRALLGSRGDRFLQAVSGFFDSWGKRILVALMLLLGLLMVVDAAFYWLRGAPLLPIGWPDV